MDISSSINAAFSQFHRSQQMSVSTGGDSSGTQVQFQARESQNSSAGRPGGVPGMALTRSLRSPFAAMSSADNLSSAVHNAVSYDRKEGGVLQLRTQEGDTVSIKFMNAESYNAQGSQFDNGGTLVSDFSMESNSFSKFKAVVEGDINAEEMQAIREVLVQAKSMADSFYGGEVKAAFGVASQFSIDSQQLANADLNLRLQETYTYANQVAEVQVSPDADATAPASQGPGEQTQPVAPAVTSTAPNVTPVSVDSQPGVAPTAVSLPDVTAVASVPVDSGPSAVTVATPASVETPPVHAEPNPADNLASALSTITDFLSQLTETLSAFGQQMQNSDSQSSYSFSAGFQLQLMSVVIEQMDKEASVKEPFSGHLLASETLSEMAMKVDAQVDSVV